MPFTGVFFGKIHNFFILQNTITMLKTSSKQKLKKVKFNNPFFIDGDYKNSFKEKVLLIISGCVVGLINGLFGGGGGMLVVPTLIYLIKKPVKVAHATAILIILPTTLASALVYLFQGRFELLNGRLVSGGVIAGGAIGALFLGKLNPKLCGIVFSLIMLFAGIRSAFF